MITNNFLITGASSSIGSDLVTYLSGQEFESKLILTSRRAVPGLEQIASSSLDVKYITDMDLLEQGNSKIIAQECKSFFSGKFCVIHSVGNFWDHVPFTKIDTKSAQEMMNSHYLTFYGLMQEVIPVLVDKGGGSVLAFSCNSVQHNYPYMIPFTAAKAAVEALVKCLAHEYAKKGISANALALSSVQTERVKESKPSGDFEHYIPKSELSKTIFETVRLNQMVNGNILSCYIYSDSFYNQGYFQRIR